MKKLRLPKKEKEERICELLKQGVGVREISKDQHVSFSEVTRIRKKYFETDDDDSPQNSKRSQALKLMQEAILDLEIAIELNLSPDEVKGFREEYLTLKGDDQLLEIYRRIGGKTEPFLKLYEMMTEEDLSPEQAVWILQDEGSFKNMEKKFTDLAKKLRPLREEVYQLQKQREVSATEYERSSDEVDQLELREQKLTIEVERLTHSLGELQVRKQELGSIVEGFVGVIDRGQQNSQNALEQSDSRLDLDWIGKTPRKIDDRLLQEEDESDKELSD